MGAWKEDLKQKDKTIGTRNGWLRIVQSTQISSMERGSRICSFSYLACGSSDVTGRWLEISFILLCWLVLSPILQAWNAGLLLAGIHVNGSNLHRCWFRKHAIRGGWDRMEDSLAAPVLVPQEEGRHSADERLVKALSGVHRHHLNPYSSFWEQLEHPPSCLKQTETKPSNSLLLQTLYFPSDKISTLINKNCNSHS